MNFFVPKKSCPPPSHLNPVFAPVSRESIFILNHETHSDPKVSSVVNYFVKPRVKTKCSEMCMFRATKK